MPQNDLKELDLVLSGLQAAALAKALEVLTDALGEAAPERLERAMIEAQRAALGVITSFGAMEPRPERFTRIHVAAAAMLQPTFDKLREHVRRVRN